MISQGFFLVSGYSVNVGLARILGPKQFGDFGVVMSFLLVVQLFVITGIPIALQKYVAENIPASRLLLRKTLPWQLLYSIGVFAFFWFAAPIVARLLKDQSLSFYLQIASIDIIFYGLYKYFLSMQNGLHQFGKQTITGIAYALSKPLAIFTLVFWGYGVSGAIVGNTLGSVGGLLVGLLIIRFPKVTGKLSDVDFFKFAFANVFYFVGFQLLFSIDIWFTKYFLDEVTVGTYVSASSVAKIPYFLSLAISSALLPSVSKATKANDEQRVRDIVRITMRYWLMLLLVMMVIVGATSNALITLFFGEDYATGGAVLAILFAAIAVLTFSGVMNTILISRNRLNDCLRVIGVLILLHVAANAVLVPALGAMGAACATLAVAVAGSVMSGYLLFKETRIFIPLSSVIRLMVTSGLVFWVAQYLPLLKGLLPIIAKCLLLAAAFTLTLFLSKELNFADLKRMRAIVLPGK